MKKSSYCGLLLNVPNRVKWIAKSENGVIYGYREEPKFINSEWVSYDNCRWYIGSYEVELVASESLVRV